MKIAIGSPIKNRAWILPEHLKSLENINWDNKQYIFMPNNCSDNTIPILKDFQSKNSNTSIKILDTKEHVSEERTSYYLNNYSHLADMRNLFIEFFLTDESCKDAEYLLSIDCDIIAIPETLKLLYKYSKPNKIIGAAISNLPNKKLDGKVNSNFMKRSFGNTFMHLQRYPLNGILQVDMVGAISLIPRKLLEIMYNKDKEIYKPHNQGEDLGFALNVPNGTEFYVNMDCKCEHKMIKYK